MKTVQVMHFVHYGKEYSVIKRLNCQDPNPYRVYHHYRDIGPDGWPREHRKQVGKYADLRSCFCWFLKNDIV